MPEEAIKLIVGLGNPGPKYEQTRHNVGFWFVDLIAGREGVRLKPESRFHGETGQASIGPRDCRLLKPSTYMNRSGQAVSSLAKYFDIPMEQILVVHDELDLPAGVIKLKKGGGHAGHNGLRDIISALGGRDFYRLRVGIDHPGDKSQVVDYVLNRPSKADTDAINDALDDAYRVLPEFLSGEFQKAMHRLHSS